MADYSKYNNKYCYNCKLNVETVGFCWSCGADLSGEKHAPKCVHCGHVPQFPSEVSDSFCRACGGKQPYKAS